METEMCDGRTVRASITVDTAMRDLEQRLREWAYAMPWGVMVSRAVSGPICIGAYRTTGKTWKGSRQLWTVVITDLDGGLVA